MSKQGYMYDKEGYRMSYPQLNSQKQTIMPNEKAKIILVDDHQFVIDGLLAIFKEEKTIEVVRTMNSGEELLQYLSEENQSKIDLILMDVSMEYGKLDGVQTAERIKQRYPGIKIIMLTVNDDAETFKRAKRAGADGYIPKIKGKRMIIDAVKKSLEGDYFIDFLNQ